MSLELTDGQTTLVQEMVWCYQAASLYLNQYDPDPYRYMAYQWVNAYHDAITRPNIEFGITDNLLVEFFNDKVQSVFLLQPITLPRKVVVKYVLLNIHWSAGG